MITANKNAINWYEGMKIKDVITLVGYKECYHPGLLVSLNGKHITFKNFSQTSVLDGDEVNIRKVVGAG